MLAEERPHRSAPDAGSGNLPRRVRTFLGLTQDPPLPRPRPARLDAIRRSWLAAFWHGRISVRAGVSLDDYLRSRLASYVAAVGVPQERLPFSVQVEEGQLVVRSAPPVRAGAADVDPDVEPWLAPLVAAEGPAVRQEVIELELRLATVDGEIEAARRRREELARRLSADVSAGIVAAPSSVEATAEQMGRPTVRGAGVQGILLAAAGAAVVAETWQIAASLLRGAGIDVARLAEEARRVPAELALVTVFALGVSVGLFALAHTAVDLAVRAFELDGDERRRRWLGGASAGALLFAALVAAATATLPSTAAAAPSLPVGTLVLLLVAVPLATTLVVRAARREGARRDVELADALAWDRERARALAERARRIEEVAFAEAEERELERLRDAARRRLREINVRALLASRLAADAARRERTTLHRVAQSLVAALELDRYEFVRQASARGAADLVLPRRRKPGEGRPALAEPPAAAEPGRAAM